MKVAIYLRVSSEEQRERQSIATQRAEVLRYCEAHGITEPAIYADDGISGTVPFEQRPAGAHLLQDARDGRIGKVLIYKLDRLGRDTRITLNAIKQLEDLGVEIAATSEPYDSTTPAGRFMTTIMAGQATLERENIRERMMAGINRLVREGAWVGGIVPYGYCLERAGREAQLVVSESPVPGTGLTEAGVIRLIFRMSAEEGKSCITIADHLNRLGVPAAYARESPGNLIGKRRRATSGTWHGCRIQYVLNSTTYKGVHVYGKIPRDPKGQRSLIERPVPAIVDAELWERAQRTLRRNALFSWRNARRKYLLRGLIKCAHCGRTYVGTGYSSARGRFQTYYVCNGRQQGRKAWPSPAGPCRAKQVSGDIENLVWRDVEGFLRDPEPVLRELVEKLVVVEEGSAAVQSHLAAMKSALAGKDEERNRVIGLFRRGRIDDAAVDRQLDEIERERLGLREEIRQLEAAGTRAREAEAQLKTTEDLLRELNGRLDEPLTWEIKRQLVETLVEGIRVETVGEGVQRDSHVTVTYRFSVPDDSIATHTGAQTSGALQ